jgi:hypothetical protein
MVSIKVIRGRCRIVLLSYSREPVVPSPFSGSKNESKLSLGKNNLCALEISTGKEYKTAVT